MTAQEELDKHISHVGLDVHSKFIPWDGNGEPELKWGVTVYRLSETLLTCEYTAGIGHAPSYPAMAAHDECRTGKSVTGKAILPDSRDVIQSLCIESSALDYGCFEDWARDLGYDTDSRKAEAIYRECLQHAIMLRARLGSEKFDHLCHLSSQL